MTNLTSGDKARIEQLKKDVYDYVFTLLDNEIELTGMDAGMIATKAEKVVQDQLTELLGYE